MNSDTLKAIRHSALWAAYGDALGFITELADIGGLQWRMKAPRVAQTVSWRRTIGGRFGVEATLPAGCYSDDTQLRLATSRALRGDGKFDVEAFAKVELPVWLAYPLGAGRGTKLAAASYRSPDVAWFSNFFQKSRIQYTDCGGNGAAMRIQPHVWAAANKSKSETYLLDVLRNSVCTHGHLRGVLGAVFHAQCLAATIQEDRVTGPSDWKDLIDFSNVAPLMREDHNLGSIWLSVWEERTGQRLDEAIKSVAQECLADIEVAARFIGEKSESSYHKLVEAIGGLTEEQRGSGTKTAIIAAALSWIHRDDYPATALVKAANLLGSDTDTIATMAGAILGSVSNEAPRAPILDQKYIDAEASRLHRISQGEAVESFVYPDLFAWHAPRTQLDAVGLADGTLAVAGLGRAEEIGPAIMGRKKEPDVWQWLRLEFGQTIFAKRRETLRVLPESSLPDRSSRVTRGLSEVFQAPHPKPKKSPEQPTLLDNGNLRRSGGELQLTIDQLTNEAIRSDFDEALIGKQLLSLAGGSNGIERAVAYASIIVKARMSRLQSARSNNK